MLHLIISENSTLETSLNKPHSVLWSNISCHKERLRNSMMLSICLTKMEVAPFQEMNWLKVIKWSMETTSMKVKSMAWSKWLMRMKMEVSAIVSGYSQQWIEENFWHKTSSKLPSKDLITIIIKVFHTMRLRTSCSDQRALMKSTWEPLWQSTTQTTVENYL